MPDLKWFASSMLGCIILFMFTFAVPIWSYSIFDDYSMGILSPGRALSTLLLALSIGAVIGAAMWTTVIGPIQKRRGK